MHVARENMYGLPRSNNVCGIDLKEKNETSDFFRFYGTCAQSKLNIKMMQDVARKKCSKALSARPQCGNLNMFVQ
jgi:hypothetical protein